MSLSYKQGIECPKCGKESEFTFWRSINTAIDPDLKEKVRTREVFQFVCPACGHKAEVDYGFLYHQMEDHYMIYYVGQEEVEQTKESLDSAREDAFLSKFADGYIYRIVTSKQQLMDKLNILDSGYDDRIVEIMKLFVLLQHSEENDVQIADEMFYYRNTDGSDGFVLYSNRDYVCDVTVSNELYLILAEHYLPMLGERTAEYIIDQEWARNVLHLGGEES